MIDSHCHLNFDRYDEDRDTVIQRAKDAGVSRIIIPAVDLPTIREVVDLATQHEGIYAAVGIHPTSTADFQPSYIESIEDAAKAKKVVAIGEIGLDYYWDKSPKEKQKEALAAHLELASKLELPVIIHNRDAGDDLIAILEDWANNAPDSLKDRFGVLHSFSASQPIADRAVAAGFYLGFTGPITFRNADELRRIAATVPLDRILVETDGPFLAPTPYRGKRNEPAYIPHIVERLASIKTISPDEMAHITTKNTERLFAL